MTEQQLEEELRKELLELRIANVRAMKRKLDDTYITQNHEGEDIIVSRASAQVFASVQKTLNDNNLSLGEKQDDADLDSLQKLLSNKQKRGRKQLAESNQAMTNSKFGQKETQH